MILSQPSAKSQSSQHFYVLLRNVEDVSAGGTNAKRQTGLTQNSIAQTRQSFLFHPFANYSNYQMPMKNLYMVGAATWPGSGLNATSGYLCAQKLLHSPLNQPFLEQILSRLPFTSLE